MLYGTKLAVVKIYEISKTVVESKNNGKFGRIDRYFNVYSMYNLPIQKIPQITVIYSCERVCANEKARCRMVRSKNHYGNSQGIRHVLCSLHQYQGEYFPSTSPLYVYSSSYTDLTYYMYAIRRLFNSCRFYVVFIASFCKQQRKEKKKIILICGGTDIVMCI